MKHSFDIKIAEKYGLEESILIDNLLFWITKNKANSKHFYNGKFWTYNSTKAFSELFPYWNEKKISRIIASLVEQNVIEKGCFNQNAYDRTSWFSFTEKWIVDNPNMSYSISQKREMEMPETGNGKDENGKSTITDNKQDIKKIEKPIIMTFEEFWSLYPKKIGRAACEPKFNKLPDSDKQKIKDTLKDWTNHKPFATYNHPNPATYISQQRWNDEIPTVPVKKDPLAPRPSSNPVNPYDAFR